MNATITSSNIAHTHSGAGSSPRLPVTLAVLDGQTVIGHAGALRIVFSPKSLSPLQSPCYPVHWLIPLSDSELAMESVRIHGEILWLCAQPPSQLLGSLASEVQGVWWDGPVITLKWHQGVETYSIPNTAFLEGSLLLLAEVVSRRWVGQTHAQVQNALNHVHQRYSAQQSKTVISSCPSNLQA